MSRPSVRLQLPDGSQTVLGPGALIGRSAAAALQLDDPSISEAQALVSLRGRQLKLLALRGRFRVGKHTPTELVLAPGQTIGLSAQVALHVLEVVLPDQVLALEGLSDRAVELSARTYSLVGTPPTLVAELDPAAHAWVWSTDDGYRLRRGEGTAQPVEPGAAWEIAGASVRVTSVDLARAAVPETSRDQADRPPLRIVCRYDTVHLHAPNQSPVVLDGLPARILTELVRFDAPTPWDWVARELWGPLDRDVLRQRWDRNLRRLRKQLRTHGLDPQMVRSDGSGNIELVARAEDQVVDAS